MTSTFLDTCLWRDARALAIERDAGRCTVSRLLGGSCSSGPLHVHHLVRPEDGGEPYGLDNLLTVCGSCHPRLEAMRRYVDRSLRGDRMARCHHRHRSRESRELCEARMSRDRAKALADAVDVALTRRPASARSLDIPQSLIY